MATENTDNKKMCGLHGMHVELSAHNRNGKCQCLTCNGMHCQECSVYKIHQAHEAWACMVSVASRCALCRGCENQR